jgi:hydrogenase expression/formation protein HypE
MAEAALAPAARRPQGRGRAARGHVAAANPGKVVLRTALGGKRLLNMLEGEQLPRIC